MVSKILKTNLKFSYLKTEFNSADFLTKSTKSTSWINPTCDRDIDLFITFWAGPPICTNSDRFLHLPPYPNNNPTQTCDNYQSGLKKHIILALKTSPALVETNLVEIQSASTAKGSFKNERGKKSIQCLLINRFDNIQKVLGVLAVVFKFLISLVKSRDPEKRFKLLNLFDYTIFTSNNTILSSAEQRKILMHLFIRESQITYFRNDYLNLYNDSRIEPSSKLKTFAPAPNNNGVMYCQTCLDNLNEDLQQLVVIHPT